METNSIKQNFQTTPARINAAVTAPAGKKPEEKQANHVESKSNMSGATKLGLSLAGLAILSTASYFILRGKASKTIEKPLDNVFDEIRDIAKDFKPHFKNATKKVETVLKDGRTKITYSGVNEDGAKVRDIIVLNKDKSIIQVMQAKNKKTGEFVSNTIKGDKNIILLPLKDVPEANVFKGCERGPLEPGINNKNVFNWIDVTTDNYSRKIKFTYDKDNKLIAKHVFNKTLDQKYINCEYHHFAYEGDKMVGNLIETKIPTVAGTFPDKNLPNKFILKGKAQTSIPEITSNKLFDRYFDSI